MSDSASTANVTRDAVIDAFTASLDRLEVDWTRAAGLAEAVEALAGLVEPPAVAAPLPFDHASLAEENITSDPTHEAVEAARTGVTAAVLGIADYGSVVIRHGHAAEAVSLFPERHVAVLRTSDVVSGVPEALARLGPLLREERASVVLATGPSATADMGALVKGAHGPRTVHVLLLEDREVTS